MKTSRKDIERNKQQVICINSSWLGYSSNKLRHGDLFTYREVYANGTFSTRLAKCHGQVKPLNRLGSTDAVGWQILAQVSNHEMTNTYERWVPPDEVMVVTPKAHANLHILAYFEERKAQML